MHHFVTAETLLRVADSPGGGVWIQRTGPVGSKNHLSGNATNQDLMFRCVDNSVVGVMFDRQQQALYTWVP
jgi:hypothetical protein